jgi:class 3 adenylate cyclase
MTFKANLESEVKKIFVSPWEIREGKDVPTFEDLSPGNDARKLNATVLYADMADSTDLVNKYPHAFAAAIYKAYLYCAATIIKNENGIIRAYDGDRVMAIFMDGLRNDAAIRSAMKIHYAVQNIINPSLAKYYPQYQYQLKHVIGVDMSELLVARIGVRKDSDLVWVGRAANYAAKLCSLSDKYSIYITSDVFDSMSEDVKNKSLVWGKRVWKARGNITIYRSKCALPID